MTDFKGVIHTKKGLNIFVGIAPSHNKNFEDILDMYKSGESLNILINPGNYPYRSEKWDKVILDDTKMGNPTGNLLKSITFQIKKIRSYRRIIKESEKKIPRQKFTLYYCNLEDTLNNYFFFNFREKFKDDSILVEDGILNYYSYTLNSKRKKTFLIKRILFLFFGVPYRIVSGQLSGIDMEEVKKQYVRYPESAIFPEKAVALPIKKIEYLPLDNTVLFIGQDILENIIGTEKYKLCFKEIIESIASVMGDEFRLLYKPHRNGTYQTASGMLGKAFENRYQLVLDHTPVEDLIVQIQPKYIFSFYSTALLNIKMSLPKDTTVEIFSKPLDTTDPKISQLFQKSGINIIE